MRMSRGIVLYKQKTAYEMRISDWSSDVCSSDLQALGERLRHLEIGGQAIDQAQADADADGGQRLAPPAVLILVPDRADVVEAVKLIPLQIGPVGSTIELQFQRRTEAVRSEEHTSELQSLMRISYAVFCLKKKTNKRNKQR